MSGKVLSVFTVFCAWLALFCCGAQAKYADLAGSWYTSSPVELKKEIEEYLTAARVEKIEGRVVAVIAPHAGLAYSGPVAAYSFKLLQQNPPETVIVVGFTHRRSYPGSISVFTEKTFTTPLGKAEINIEMAKRILAYDDAMKEIPEAFREENSIEMQIPFVQVALPGTRVVLVAISDQSMKVSRVLGAALYDAMKSGGSVAIIASTDMCHYLSQQSAVEKDKATIEQIKKFSPDDFYLFSLKENHESMCGPGAVYATMLASKKLGADEIKVLKYATSGDISGDKRRVVGYFSAAFVMKSDLSVREKFKTGEDDKMFNEAQRQELLNIARESIKHYLATGEKMDLETQDNALKQELGAFVTLHKSGQLRGCIGNMQATGPLYLTIRDMAIAAAVEDPRFSPLRTDELSGIDIEISVLSPMRKIADPEEIEMGKHGVMVRMGWHSGVYLPQVAAETGWDREEFMNSLCAHKAGIPRDAWKTGDADIYVYTAEVFGEKEL
jgi:MEMO1 family protein